MAITSTNDVTYYRPMALGDGVKAQLMTYRALTGASSGTITADGLSLIYAIFLDGQIQNTALPTYAANVATLAFAVPAETAASKVVQDLTYTAVANLGQDANTYTVRYIVGGTAGSEIVTVTGTNIVITIETAVSTATQVKTAFDASAAATALMSVAVTGTGSTAQIANSAQTLAGGVTGGSRGYCLVLGR